MILTIINWIWIFICAFAAGFAFREAVRKLSGYEIRRPEAVILSGTAILTIYAEIYSLFGLVLPAGSDGGYGFFRGVGFGATVVMAFFTAAIILVFRKKIILYCRLITLEKDFHYYAAVFIILAAALSLLASVSPANYDTYLYHAQSIEWIEKYGTVKGLANLHARFGYNSAFMCLQALFSWGFAGQSLHGMNGFICLVMLQYAFAAFSGIRTRQLNASDLLRICMIFYCIYNYNDISSPATDMMPMLILMYIFAEWTGLCMTGEKTEAPFILLCLLGVYDLTVKLSAAMVVLLIAYPLYLIIRKRSWKQLLYAFLAVIAIVMPFLARNVMTSGYLLYPYASADIFNVDWKAPADTVISEAKMIKLYGRSLDKVDCRELPFRQWVQVWFEYLPFIFRVMLAVFGLSLIPAAVYIFKSIRKRADAAYVLLMADAFVIFLFWFMSAPLIRYGMVFLLLLPCTAAGCIRPEYRKTLAASLVLISFVYFAAMMQNFSAFSSNLVYPGDYTEYKCVSGTVTSTDGTAVTVYAPESGDQAGYDVFPETVSLDILDSVEMRGSSLADGFRTKH